MKQQSDVRAFMQAAGQHVPQFPTDLPLETRILRARLIIEEAFEQAAAMGVHVSYSVNKEAPAISLYPEDITYKQGEATSLVEIADGIADQLYVSLGAACAFGINMEPVWKLIQDSNMAKFGPGSYKRPDGKQMKPPGWIPPTQDITTELRNQCNQGNALEKTNQTI